MSILSPQNFVKQFKPILSKVEGIDSKGGQLAFFIFFKWFFYYNNNKKISISNSEPLLNSNGAFTN